MLETKNLAFEFNSEFLIQDVNLRIESGNITVISGISGSGKSLLFSLLTKILRANHGELIYPNHIEPRIGAIFQVPALLSNLSIYHNLKLALQSHFEKMPIDEIDEKIKNTISSYDLYKYIHARPDSLSKGQQAIIAFCRAYIVDPDYFFWDDPYVNIDENFYPDIDKKIDELKNENKAIIFFTNRSEIISKYADRHYRIENRRVVYI